MEKNKNALKPIKVSEIYPVYDEKGYIKEYKLTVVFDNVNGNPPHARGANVSVISSNNVIQAEYRFPESVMKRGAEHVLRFKTQLMFQLGKDANIK